MPTRRRRLSRWKFNNVQNCPAAPKRSRALVLFIFGGYTEENISSGRYNRLPYIVCTVGRGLDPSAELCGCRIVARNVYMPPGAVSVARKLPGAVKTAPYKPF